jgi:hypothetical protein
MLGLASAASAQQAAAPAPAPAAQTAPTAAPSTTPTSAPAAPVIPINTTSPRGTMKVLSQAMEAGDSAAIKKVMHASNPAEEKMVDAMSGQAEAIGKLKSASVAKFGAQEAKKLVGDTAAQLAQAMLMFDAAGEKIEGNNATVSPQGDPQQAIHLVKVGNDWKLSVADMARQVPAGQIDRALADMNLQAKILSEIADGISKGQYKTPEEAGKDLQQKLIRAAMEQAATATAPSSGPATTAPSSGAPGNAPTAGQGSKAPAVP